MSFANGYAAFIAPSANRNRHNNRHGANRPGSAGLGQDPNLLPLNRNAGPRAERAIPPLMGDRVISRHNLFYTDSGNNSHRNYILGMTDEAAMVLLSLRNWSKPVVKQVLATACFNCGLTYHNPFTNEETPIQTYDELSRAFIQNRDVEQYGRFKYVFHDYLLLNRDWMDRLEIQFMRENHLSFAPAATSVSNSMSDIGYFLTHYKHSLVSNLQTKFKRSLTAEEQFLHEFDVRLL
jgi:hypothetical protein